MTTDTRIVCLNREVVSRAKDEGPVPGSRDQSGESKPCEERL